MKQHVAELRQNWKTLQWRASNWKCLGAYSFNPRTRGSFESNNWATSGDHSQWMR